ncbi:serine/threonine protein kinase [Kitasatospora sp. MAP12-15]|uniref:protein kinase domain-containing protein n=1 Tax=unclassified Kitasatospora TaxID=2633591 RepID=UPI002474B21E|nr:protein kinase [Kitasatospora sp. MAP12-44]MDH6113831.1 serine/threonine protein kinase [Kitasatospora sp. MAP12-44]
MNGRALNGRYVLVEILGVGGMATVWRGVDNVLGRPVAVKVLNGGLADDPRFAERFQREAQHAAMLVHPGIVTVFDSGVDQGSPYIVMELVHGEPLSQLVAGTGGLPVRRAVSIAAAVCEALAVAHEAGLVHRDVKPANIMITDDDGVKVVDFGIARVSSSSSRLTQTAMVLGTAAYLSPEQATAKPVDGRSDLYALGCVLVEMLTGQPPFLADTPVAVAFKHVSEPPEPLTVQRPEVPPALEAAVLRLLAKDPDDRPADAAAARAELLASVTEPTAEQQYQYVQQQPAGTAEQPALTPPSRTRGGRSTRPLVFGALGLIVLAATTAFALDRPSPHIAASTTANTAASAATGPARTTAPIAPVDTTDKQSPAIGLQQLSTQVNRAQLPADRQQNLVKSLDTASTALAQGHPLLAEPPLRDAQDQVRELVKRRTGDAAAEQNWLRQLGVLLTAVHKESTQPTP